MCSAWVSMFHVYMFVHICIPSSCGLFVLVVGWVVVVGSDSSICGIILCVGDYKFCSHLL